MTSGVLIVQPLISFNKRSGINNAVSFIIKRCGAKIIYFARRFTPVLAVLFLHTIAMAQLPGNTNLVSNGKFKYDHDNLFSDTTFANSGCWIGTRMGSLINYIAPESVYYDTTTQSTHPLVDTTEGICVFLQSLFMYSKSSRMPVDTNDGAVRNRNYAQNILLEPLVAGKTYKFKMHVLEIAYSPTAIAQHPVFAGLNRLRIYSFIRNLGVYFSVDRVYQPTVFRLDKIPQLNFRGWSCTKLDTMEKVELSGTYTAAGGERYITIGNFDFAKDFAGDSLLPYYPDPYGMNNMNQITDISLVADTTQPMINLSDFSLGKDITICPGQNARLGGSDHFFHYWWNTGDTTSFINTSVPGTYWCTVDYGCGNYTDTINVLEHIAPTTFTLPDTALCGGNAYTVRGPAGYTDYSWSTGATTQDAVISMPGTYTLNVTNSCGQSFADTFTVANGGAGTVPGININTIPPTTFCAGTAITFVTNNTGAGSNPHYQWYKNGNLIPGAISPTYSDAGLASHDTLTVAMYSSASCPATYPTISNKVGVTVSPDVTPQVGIIASPGTHVSTGQPVTFTATPVNGGIAPVYQWFVNMMAVFAANGDTWTTTSLHDGDMVSVQMQSQAACAFPALVNSNNIVIHTGETGFNNVGRDSVTVTLYPNPVKDLLNIDLSVLPKGARLLITDNYGRLVITPFDIRAVHNVIDINQLAAGMYFYTIIAEQASYHGKFLKP